MGGSGGMMEGSESLFGGVGRCGGGGSGRADHIYHLKINR